MPYTFNAVFYIYPQALFTSTNTYNERAPFFFFFNLQLDLLGGAGLKSSLLGPYTEKKYFNLF